MPKFTKKLAPKRYTLLVSSDIGKLISQEAKAHGMYEGQVVRHWVEQYCKTLKPAEKTPVARAIKPRTPRQRKVRPLLGKV